MGVATSLTETALFVEAGGRFGGNLTVIGNLTVNGFYSLKPYVGIYVSSVGTVSSTIKPGYITPTLRRTVVGTYVFTLLTSLPSGANYEVFVQQRKSSATIAAAVYGVIVSSSTQFTVWSTTYLNALVDSDLYVHTVP